MPITAGTTLGAYEVGELLGQGAMGTVYRAYHAGLARTAAVKVLQAIAPDADSSARFRREAQAIAQMRHPHVLNVYDFGEHEGTPYMIVEYMPGGSIGDRLKGGERFDGETAIRLLSGIAAGLDYAHGQGIVHRDVKPANVLLDGRGEPVLADFGLAKLLQQTSLKTVSGVTTGTPAYMAPEQVMGAVVGPAADTYALATMAYEFLAGAIPFEGEGMLELLYAHVHREPPAASSRNPRLAPAVDAVLARGLAKEPAARWESGTAMILALQAALSGAPVDATTRVATAAAEPASAPPRPRRRWRIVLIGAGLLAVAILVVAVLAFLAASAPPSVSLSAETVEQGGNLTMTASGFQAGQDIDIYVASTETKLRTLRADAQGEVVFTFSVPPSFPAGRHELKACAGTTCAQAPFTVAARGTATPSAKPTAAANPKITINPLSVRSGTSFQLAATGYQAGKAFAQIGSAGHAASGTTLANDLDTNGGSFSTNLTIPITVAAGSYELRVCNAPPPGAVCATTPITVTR